MLCVSFEWIKGQNEGTETGLLAFCKLNVEKSTTNTYTNLNDKLIMVDSKRKDELRSG